MNPGLCICGRSPTKYCVGWHNLSEEEYQEKKKEHDELQENSSSPSEIYNDV